MIDPVDNPTDEQLASWHRTFAPRAYNHTWTYLDKDRLTPDNELEMLTSTFAQRYHWREVGTPRHWAIADWQISRVAAVTGYFDLARRFGLNSLAICEENQLDAFVTGFAHEAIARAAAFVDDVETFEKHLALARESLSQIEDDEDRSTLAADLDLMSEA
jgi:hypothetical protein